VKATSFVDLCFVGDRNGRFLAATFLFGKFLLREFGPGGGQVFFRCGRQMTTFAPSRRKCFSDGFAESLAAAGDECVEILEFHVRHDRRKDARRRGRFFNSFSRNRLASTKTGERICGTIFAQSACRNCGHSVQTATASAPVSAAAMSPASETAASSAGQIFLRRGQRR